MEHRDILRREFERIAEFTDNAYSVLVDGEETRGEANYKDWAALLLRYHDALERVTGKEPAAPPQSMKGRDEDSHAISSPQSLPAPHDARENPVAATAGSEPETGGDSGEVDPE